MLAYFAQYGDGTKGKLATAAATQQRFYEAFARHRSALKSLVAEDRGRNGNGSVGAPLTW
jgi:hypothetical protein